MVWGISGDQKKLIFSRQLNERSVNGTDVTKKHWRGCHKERRRCRSWMDSWMDRVRGGEERGEMSHASGETGAEQEVSWQRNIIAPTKGGAMQVCVGSAAFGTHGLGSARGCNSVQTCAPDQNTRLCVRQQTTKINCFHINLFSPITIMTRARMATVTGTSQCTHIHCWCSLTAWRCSFNCCFFHFLLFCHWLKVTQQ